MAQIDPALPVMHVSWYEADAFARWAGGRLPTEAEWERAAAWDPVTGEPLPFPWGHEPPAYERANLDQTAFGPLPVGSLAGASREGVRGLIGDAWEWTASPLTGYPGFAPFPYPEYSEVFFGGPYRVLRGGSWATRPDGGPQHVPQLGPAAAAADLLRLPLRTRVVMGEAAGAADVTIVRGRGASGEDTLASDVRAALTGTPKVLGPKHLYDEYGSELYERITTEAPEYYPARSEREILNRRAPELTERRARAGGAGLGHGVQDARAAVRHGGLGRAGAVRAVRRGRVSGGGVRRRADRGLPGPDGARRGGRLRHRPAA